MQPAQEQTTPGFANVGTLERIPSTCGGYWGWNTGDAYYEIARRYEEGSNSSMHALLLKTDYATARQTVLCNVPGCTHDSAACPAWLEDWARTDLLVMPNGIYLYYTGLGDVYSWEQMEKACRDDFEQGNVKNFADEEAYIDFCRHNYELDCRPSSIEKLNDDMVKNATNSGKLAEIMREKEAAEAQLEEKMDRWVYLNDLAEQIEAQKSGN
mgnify:CR=1 FL=1